MTSCPPPPLACKPEPLAGVWQQREDRGLPTQVPAWPAPRWHTMSRGEQAERGEPMHGSVTEAPFSSQTCGNPGTLAYTCLPWPPGQLPELA